MIRLRTSNLRNNVILYIGLLILGGYLLSIYIAKNTVDLRPVKKILFIGNSRTFVNDLPFLVQHMITQSTSSVRYEIVMHALGGHTFEDHNTNPTVAKLLNTHWDYVVLQGGSPENTNFDSSESFLTHGKALIEHIQQQQSQPVLLVAWTYNENSYGYENEHYLKPDYEEYLAKYQQYITLHGKPPVNKPALDTFYPLDIKKHYLFIQRDYQQLVEQTQALKVNAGEAFKQLLAADASFKTLTSDTNHPNIKGSYLAATMLYVCFTQQPAQSTHYVPINMTKTDANAIRLFVDQFYPNGTCLSVTAET